MDEERTACMNRTIAAARGSISGEGGKGDGPTDGREYTNWAMIDWVKV